MATCAMKGEDLLVYIDDEDGTPRRSTVMKDKKKGLDKDGISTSRRRANSILLTTQQRSCLFFTIVPVTGGIEPDID
jgi:hypothetical protein